jgi:hypothetical protein
MALTIENLERGSSGNLRVVTGTIAFDSSYPTGGESLTPANMALSRVQSVSILPKSGYVFEYDYTNSKVLAYYADYDAVADGALIQVPDTTNLSTLTGVRFNAIGV